MRLQHALANEGIGDAWASSQLPGGSTHPLLRNLGPSGDVASTVGAGAALENSAVVSLPSSFLGTGPAGADHGLQAPRPPTRLRLEHRQPLEPEPLHPPPPEPPPKPAPKLVGPTKEPPRPPEVYWSDEAPAPACDPGEIFKLRSKLRALQLTLPAHVCRTEASAADRFLEQLQLDVDDSTGMAKCRNDYWIEGASTGVTKVATCVKEALEKAEHVSWGDHQAITSKLRALELQSTESLQYTGEYHPTREALAEWAERGEEVEAHAAPHHEGHPDLSLVHAPDAAIASASSPPLEVALAGIAAGNPAGRPAEPQSRRDGSVKRTDPSWSARHFL